MAYFEALFSKEKAPQKTVCVFRDAKIARFHPNYDYKIITQFPFTQGVRRYLERLCLFSYATPKWYSRCIPHKNASSHGVLSLAEEFAGYCLLPRL